MIRDLLTPENFAGDQYGLFTNQTAHVLVVGTILYSLAFWFLKRVNKPCEWGAIFLVVVCYFWFEFFAQGWHDHDTLADTAFVTLGAVLASQLQVKNLWVFWVTLLAVGITVWLVNV